MNHGNMDGIFSSNMIGFVGKLVYLCMISTVKSSREYCNYFHAQTNKYITQLTLHNIYTVYIFLHAET